MSNNTTAADGYYDEDVNSEEIDLSFLDENEDSGKSENQKPQK